MLAVVAVDDPGQAECRTSSLIDEPVAAVTVGNEVVVTNITSALADRTAPGLPPHVLEAHVGEHAVPAWPNCVLWAVPDRSPVHARACESLIGDG